MKVNSPTLWNSLNGVISPAEGGNYTWSVYEMDTRLISYDFESVATYNSNVHQINWELRFRNSAVLDANLIDEMCSTSNPFMRISDWIVLSMVKESGDMMRSRDEWSTKCQKSFRRMTMLAALKLLWCGHMSNIERKYDTFKHLVGLEVQSIGTSNKAHGKRNVGSHAQT